jgi:large exoprotein involved in heme utilization and adhesion
VITGRGGLPPSPSDPRDEDAVTTEWATLSNQDQEHQEHQREAKTEPDLNPLETDAKRIVEAQGWVQDNNGNVLLLAQAPTVTPQTARSIGCHQPHNQSRILQSRQQF